MKSYWRLLSLLLCCLYGMAAFAQETTATSKKAVSGTESIISSNRYVFRAQNATPMSGRVRQLTSEYDVTVLKDSVIAFLPYFGRAYTAPMDPTQGGIQFTSVQFTNTTTARKKGGWDVVIKPEGIDVQTLNFSISKSGYATLQVTSTNRQPISFYGIIEAWKAPKK